MFLPSANSSSRPITSLLLIFLFAYCSTFCCDGASSSSSSSSSATIYHLPSLTTTQYHRSNKQASLVSSSILRKSNNNSNDGDDRRRHRRAASTSASNYHSGEDYSDDESSLRRRRRRQQQQQQQQQQQRQRRRRRRRKLSISDQLDILRLGFIPTSSSQLSTKDEKQQSERVEMGSRILVNRIPRGGGGNGIIDHGVISTAKSCQQTQPTHPLRQQQLHHRQHCRQLSPGEQLDILRLGFIPTTSTESTNSSLSSRRVHHSNNAWLNIARFNRGGGGRIGTSSSSRAAAMTTTVQNHRQRFTDIIVRFYFHFSRPQILASIFAFLAGYSNVLCYHKFQCYATMMTGNIVTMSMFLAEQNWGEALWRCTLVACYLIGSSLVRAIELQCQKCTTTTTTTSSSDSSGALVSQQRKQHYKVIAPIVAAIFAIAEKLLSSSTSSSYKIVVPMLALGYGMTYATANRALDATMTQLLTGHITKLGTLFSDYTFGRSSAAASAVESHPSSGKKKEAIMSSCILSSFVFGGIVGSRLLSLVATGFPHFALLGLIYALVLMLF